MLRNTIQLTTHNSTRHSDPSRQPNTPNLLAAELHKTSTFQLLVNMVVDAVQVLARRQSLFERMTAERDAAPIGSAERATLEAATARCAQKLATCAGEVLRTNAKRRTKSTTELPELESARATAQTLGKWRSRLTRELHSLRAAAERLDAASGALALAAADSQTSRPRKSFDATARTHFTLAADALDTARSTPFVRRALSAATSLRLRNRAITRDDVTTAKADVHNASRLLSEVVTKCDDELVALTAAHAQLDEAIMRAIEQQCPREASRCDRMSQTPALKRALCLLITVT